MSEGIAGAILAGFGLLPFILGFRVLSEPASARRLVVALCGAMLAYSLPMLVEIRLSPQLNAWIYGFFPHEFQQTMRYGGRVVEVASHLHHDGRLGHRLGGRALVQLEGPCYK